MVKNEMTSLDTIIRDGESARSVMQRILTHVREEHEVFVSYVKLSRSYFGQHDLIDMYIELRGKYTDRKISMKIDVAFEEIGVDRDTKYGTLKVKYIDWVIMDHLHDGQSIIFNKTIRCGTDKYTWHQVIWEAEITDALSSLYNNARNQDAIFAKGNRSEPTNIV